MKGQSDSARFAKRLWESAPVRPGNCTGMSADEDGLELNPAQERILHLYRVFLGGTGKCFLLHRTVETLGREFNTKVAMTAPTGLAAALIGGGDATFSFAGCNVPSLCSSN